MMPQLPKHKAALLVVVIVITSLLMACPFGDEGTTVTLINQTSMSIKVDITWVLQNDTVTPEVLSYKHSKDPVVSPSKSIKVSTLIDPDREDGIHFKYFVTVVTESGILWQKVFVWDELDEMDWTITVKPQ